MKTMPIEEEKKEATFEDSLKELEEIVENLEKGELPLEESFSLFQKGIDLSVYCSSCLEKIEKRVRVLTDLSGDGTTEDFLSEGNISGEESFS